MSVGLKLDEEKEIENIYEKAKIKENPFSHSGLPSETVEIFADFIKIWYKIQEKIKLVINRGYNQNFLLFGEYGRGKTHILKYIYYVINKLKIKKVVFFTQLPQNLRFKNLYKQLISKNLNEEKIINLFKDGIPSRIPGPLGSDVKTAIECILKNNHRKTAWNWLSGNTTLSDARRRIEVSNRIDNSDDNCFEAFISLLKAFVESNVDIIYVGIDELETARIRTSAERRMTEELLVYFRRFIDNAPKNIFFMLAATDEFRRIFRQMGPIISRIPPYDVETIPLIDDLNTMKHFILGYLDSVRPDEFFTSSELNSLSGFDLQREELEVAFLKKEDINSIVEKYNEKLDISLYPFKSEALEKLRVISGGLSRNIVRGCHYLIENFVLNYEDTYLSKGIDSDYIEHLEDELKSLFIEVR